MSPSLRCPLCGPSTGGTRPPLLDPSGCGRQLNVGLVPIDGQGLPSARRAFAELMPELADRVARGELHHAWFMRKPPGIRLRFGGSAAADTEAWGLEVLDRLRAQGVVSHAFSSIYEPESFALGGPAAVPALHRWFTADSLGWWQWDRTLAEGSTAVGVAVLTLAIVNDLCLRATGDARSEVWDVWRNLDPELGEEAPEAIPPLRLDDLGAFPIEGSLVDRYRDANQRLALELGQLWRKGRLALGMRALLMTAVMFHWNRFGLPLDTRHRLCAAMDRALGPLAASRRPDA